MNAQASLFDRPVVRIAPQPSATGIALRPYQTEAVARIREQLWGAAAQRSTLIVMATGTGKTTVFSDVVAKAPGRSLVIAHRGELLDQAIARIRRQTGKAVAREQAGRWAWDGSDVVVASVATLKGERLQRFRPDEFSLLVIDEAHHAPASSYRAVMDHFTGAKVLGVTATPDRADEQAMGAVFDDVAFVYEIDDAIRDGWLCRIRANRVMCGDLDLSAVKTVAGDLNQGDLDDVMSMEKVLHQVVGPTLELAGTRRTLMFTTSRENAHRMAEVFNRHRTGCARAVDGESTDREQARADHQAGKFQFLVNCMLFTEGYDDPHIACVGIARPTKSRALYAQMAGRGTRIAPGKSDLLLLDFVGNSGRHSLVGAADVLAGKHPEEVVAKARQKVAEEPGKDISEAIAEAAIEVEEAKKREAARRARIVARAAYTKVEVDPFRILGAKRASEWEQRFQPAATEKQRAALEKMGVIKAGEALTRGEAGRLISAANARRASGLATVKQARALAKFGYQATNMPFATASRLMDMVARNGWKRLGAEQYAAAIGNAEPGSAG